MLLRGISLTTRHALLRCVSVMSVPPLQQQQQQQVRALATKATKSKETSSATPTQAPASAPVPAPAPAPCYPAHMDLGDAFYQKLFDPAQVMARRKENMAAYPPEEAFMKMLPSMANADAHQFSLYWAGVYGKLPVLPVDPELLTKKFIAEADPDAVVWLLGRAGSKQTYYNNQSDFDLWKIVPRMMTGLGKFDPSVSFKLGKHQFDWASPIAVAPVGVQARVASERADMVTAGAAAQVIPCTVKGHSLRIPMT
jgi:hypothetical protein